MTDSQAHTPLATPKTTGFTFVLILSALMAITSLSTDIYLPAMPVMAKDLQGDAELTITGFLIGFCIAQLVWGPISDHFGRRLPMCIGMVLFVMGSVGCALSTDIVHIVFWRVFQALGACTGPMLARAMIRDLYSRTRAAQMMSTLMIVMAIAPIAGPLLGGQMIHIASWHAIFWLLAIIGAVMLLAIGWLPETLPESKRVKASLSGAFRNYYRLLTHATFMRFTLCVTFYYVAAYAFITGSPFVYISYFGVEPAHYGWYIAIRWKPCSSVPPPSRTCRTAISGGNRVWHGRDRPDYRGGIRFLLHERHYRGNIDRSCAGCCAGDGGFGIGTGGIVAVRQRHYLIAATGAV